MIFSRKPIKGIGNLFRISYLNNNTEMEFAVNRGSILETAEWKSNGRIIFLDYGISHNLKSIMLVEFTFFKYGKILIESDVPVTLYLERNKSQWLGYIESSENDNENKLDIKGMIIKPVRFNHQIIVKDKIIQTNIDEESFRILLI